MTNLEDALTAVEAGADAVGFVFYEKSPRNISAEAAREIVRELPGSIEKVGVFVRETASTINEVSNRVGLTLVQTYPDLRNTLSIPNDRFVEKMRCGVIVALTIKQLSDDESDRADVIRGIRVSDSIRNRVAGVLLDSGNADRPGGTGRKFDWERIVPIAEMMTRTSMRWILAGGLTPENVGEGMALLKPWGVDVVSAIEALPGKKDPEKVRAFINAVREIDRRAI